MARQTRPQGANRSAQSRHATNMVPRIQRSTFNRSSTVKTTLDSGRVYPILVDEILPGDTVQMSIGGFCRMATPLHPVLEDVVVDLHCFFIPHRIVWDNALAFWGEQDDLDNPIDYLIPEISIPAEGINVGSMLDYMGVPTGRGPFTVSALPQRCMIQLYNDWFRHQELQPKLPLDKGDGPDAIAAIPQRNRRHDYFAAALTSPQRGEEVELPIGGSAPLVGNPNMVPVSTPTFLFDGAFPDAPLQNQVGSSNVEWQGTQGVANSNTMDWSNIGLRIDLDTTGPGGVTPEADLTQAAGVTVSAFRELLALQHYLELEARSGSRYAELVNAFFGVNFPDRLYRAELCGSMSIPINVYQVTQMSGTAPGVIDTPQGNLAAYAQGGKMQGIATKSFVEHGHIIVTASVRRGAVSYQQGLHKMWSRRTKFDHYFPQFAGLGEQAILNQEIFIDGTAADTEVWGYIPRWDEYRFGPGNRVTGQMRSDFAQSLDAWHLADDYGQTRPSLNATWMQELPPMERVLAVQDVPEFIFEAAFNLQHTRAMPIHGVPGLRRI